jgi:chemotaxis protein CheX
MMSSDHPALHAEFPFAGKLRSSDRDEMLVQLMASVWETMLGLPILARESGQQDDLSPCGEPVVSASIRIAGAWDGSATLSAPRTFAAKCTAIMLERPAETLSELEVRDAWGELVNMVGGHLKSLVPPPSRLGLPVVVDPADPAPGSTGPTGERPMNRITFACMGQRVRLTVHHSQL